VGGEYGEKILEGKKNIGGGEMERVVLHFGGN
jgi:hypothetical protein